MNVKVAPYNELLVTGPIRSAGITLGDNSCLPSIIADTFGWEAINIEFTGDNDKPQAIAGCKKRAKIVLLPFFSYGPSQPASAVKEITQSLKQSGYRIEWRLFQKATGFSYDEKVSTVLILQNNADTQFEQFSSNLRRKIRKSTSNGIRFRSGQKELLNDFYRVYSRNMHRLGSPALPFRWFSNLLEQYRNGKASVWCAYSDQQPIGAAFTLSYNGFMEACWFATSRQFNNQYTPYGLHWEIIRNAIEQGTAVFSFGRSTSGSGVHQYKKQWGGKDIPLSWNFSHPQERNIRRYSFLSELWKILPYPIARSFGPLIAGKFY